MNKTYTPGKVHPLLLQSDASVRECTQTSPYILQATRAAFNQNEVSPTCQLCNTQPETMEHFLLHCDILDTIHLSVLCDIIDTC